MTTASATTYQGTEHVATTAAVPTTTHFRRTHGAAMMLIAPWLFVVTNGLYAWATSHGGDDQTGAHAIALVGRYVGLWRVILASGMLGCLLMTPAVLTLVRLIRAKAPRLSLFAGIAVAAGYLCYFGVLSLNYATIALVTHGGSLADRGAVIDAAQKDPSSMWVFIVFVFGNLVGTLLLALALFRSRSSVPVWTAACVAAWPVLHIVGLIVGTEWFEVAGGVLQAVGFAALAVRVLRTSDEEWSRLG